MKTERILAELNKKDNPEKFRLTLRGDDGRNQYWCNKSIRLNRLSDGGVFWDSDVTGWEAEGRTK